MPTGSKLAAYVVEGSPDALFASKAALYAVEGPVVRLYSAKAALYVVEGAPIRVYAGRLGFYVIDGLGSAGGPGSVSDPPAGRRRQLVMVNEF